MQIPKAIKKLFAFDPSPQTFRRAYLKSMFFWNPLLCPALSLFLGGFDQIGPRLIVTVIISTVVSNFCFGVVGLFYLLEKAWGKWHGTAAPEHSQIWWVSISCGSMPLGLYVAFKIVFLIAPKIGLVGWTANPDDYRVGLLIGALILGLLFLVRTRMESKEAHRQAQLRLKQMENERLQAQISALTAQMNPHLMFNALNTVASLVQTDPQKAEDTIVKLSELYRGVLNSSRKMMHSLSTELKICEAYLSVEKARFGDRLNSKIEVDTGIDRSKTLIPALSIQPLVENAIKHGLSSRAAGGSVSVFVFSQGEKLKISVEDDGIGFQAAAAAPAKKAGAGTGLKNCQERLRLHYGADGIFELSERDGGGAKVVLTMPVTSEGASL